MGTAGFGKGNMSPVAEFNVFVDAESYDIMLNSQIPITIAGFDLCLGDASFTPEELTELAKTPLGKFIADCNSTRLKFNEELTGSPYVDLPDAVAMAAALYEDVITEKINAYCYCCTKEEATYGQVIIYDISKPYTSNYSIPKTNTTVIKAIDVNKFKAYLKEALK